MTRVPLLCALAIAPSFCSVEYSSPPSRCPALECKLTGQIPCVSDADCSGGIDMSCQATTCQSRCAWRRIGGECCDRDADCTSGWCVFTDGPPGTCGPG